MATRQRQRTEQTRLAILLAARDLLRENGYAATTVADIVVRCGRAHGTFYLYFDNKRDVFDALLVQLVSRFSAACALPPSGAPALPSVDDTVRQLAALIDAHRDLWCLIEEMAVTDTAVLAIRRDAREELETWFAAHLPAAATTTRGHRDQRLLLVELVVGSLLWIARPGSPVDTPGLVDNASRMLSVALDS